MPRWPAAAPALSLVCTPAPIELIKSGLSSLLVSQLLTTLMGKLKCFLHENPSRLLSLLETWGLYSRFGGTIR